MKAGSDRAWLSPRSAVTATRLLPPRVEPHHLVEQPLHRRAAVPVHSLVVHSSRDRHDILPRFTQQQARLLDPRHIRPFLRAGHHKDKSREIQPTRRKDAQYPSPGDPPVSAAGSTHGEGAPSPPADGILPFPRPASPDRNSVWLRRAHRARTGSPVPVGLLEPGWQPRLRSAPVKSSQLEYTPSA